MPKTVYGLAGEPDGGPHLGEVLRAIGATGEVGLEPAAVGKLGKAPPGSRSRARLPVGKPGLCGATASSGLPGLGLEGLAQAASAPVQQHPLVALSDVQQCTYL